MERTEAELIAAVLKGDAASFEPLIERYSPRVFATARRYARRESEIEDIVQEVWLKAYQKLKSFRGEAPFEHWLMRLAVRTCYDFLRGHQRNRESAFSDLSEPEDDWLERFIHQPGEAREDADAARQLVQRATTSIAAGAAGDHAAGNRGSVSERDFQIDGLVGAAGESARFSRPGGNAQDSGKNCQRQVSVTQPKHGASN
jgi:RNA polymerase sigma-70 factor (ECF subfamily)